MPKGDIADVEILGIALEPQRTGVPVGADLHVCHQQLHMRKPGDGCRSWRRTRVIHATNASEQGEKRARSRHPGSEQASAETCTFTAWVQFTLRGPPVSTIRVIPVTTPGDAL